MDKYRLLTDDFKELPTNGIKLYRIEALMDFGDVKKGDKGGYIQSEGDNLSHEKTCWVYGDARVSGDAWVYGNALVSGDAWVYGDAQVSGNAWVYGDARVYGNARVSGNAWVSGDAEISSSNDVFWMTGFGSENRTTTVFVDNKIEGGWRVVCGCFTGTISEFADKVKETHGNNQYGKEYLLLIDLILLRIKR